VNGNKDTCKISIIVPVYNSETYLKACLDSIVNQTLKNIEIIILNDGSTDNSESIIKEYQKKDNRIKYYYHTNIGLGLTRNKGIVKAKGEYIAFIDSDDYIALDMMEKMYNKAINKKLDVVCAKIYIEEKEGIYIRQEHIKAQTIIDINKVGIKYFLHNYVFTNIYQNCVWDKIYKRTFLLQNKLFCGDTTVFAEDLYCQFKLILQKPIIGFLNEPLYYYVQRDDSIMHSVRKNFMIKHLNMISYFYKLNEKHSAEISMFVDGILFRIILDEIKWFLKHNIKFSQVRKQFLILYNNPIYNIFMKSLKKNHSYKLHETKKARYLFYLFYILQRLHLRLLSELLLYTKQYISLKKNNRPQNEI